MRSSFLKRARVSVVLVAVFALCVPACGGKADEDSRRGTGDGDGDQPIKYENGSFLGCTNPADYMPGTETGYFNCEEGHLWRREVVTCENKLPQNNLVEFPDVVLMAAAGGAGPDSGYEIAQDDCSSNADCGENQFCKVYNSSATGECIGYYYDGPEQWRRVCVSGCTEDADCGDGYLCLCGPEIGQCLLQNGNEHSCASDADCGAGLHCLNNVAYGFACQLPDDECQSRADCGSGMVCDLPFDADGRVCGYSAPEGC